MSQPDLSAQHETVLRDMVISDETPGAILHDFQVMLDFVAREATYLTDNQMLPMKVLQPLNEALNRRVELRLVRPQQKSYPHINGLFLLLRASGITFVDFSGRKPVLLLDPSAIDSWNALNPDERYFCLLESWLIEVITNSLGNGRVFLSLRLHYACGQISSKGLKNKFGTIVHGLNACVIGLEFIIWP